LAEPQRRGEPRDPRPDHARVDVERYGHRSPEDVTVQVPNDPYRSTPTP
jgi:hypothetical protein